VSQGFYFLGAAGKPTHTKEARVVTKSRLPISAIKHAIVGVGGGVGFTS
jgi:hypothetical protein